MTRGITRVMQLGVLWLGFVGCGGGGGGGGGGGSGGVSLGQLPASFAQTVCTQNFKCCSAADIGEVKMSDCLDNNTALLSAFTSFVGTSQSQGRVTYDGTQMGDCLSALRAQTCADWNNTLLEPASCNLAIVAKVELGGPCQQDFECKLGHCDGATTATNTMAAVDGVCKANTAVGSACTFADTCVDNSYCDSTTMLCTPQKAGGVACDSDDQCVNTCNTTTGKCSGYAGCSVGAATGASSLTSLALLSCIVIGARRRRRAQKG
jgi:hypothetical protein